MEDRRSTILVIDDVRMYVEILSAFLEVDYNVISATSGREGLELAQSRNPDLILLDVLMPEMDGYEVCVRLKSDYRTRNIPVIFISAMTQEEDEHRGLAVGAIDYVTKPFSPPIVQARVRNHLELKHYRDFLENLSMRDGLTGVPNRRRFEEYLDSEWRRAQRSHNWIGLALMDIDHFKQYNDHYGHLAGDDCLRQVAEAMNNCMRRPADLLARYGGEEFACILPATDRTGIVTVAENILNCVRDLRIPHAVSSTEDNVTISVGITALVPQPGEGPETCLKLVDELLYDAKKTGRNRVKIG